MHPTVKKSLCSIWTFQGLTMAVISIILCKVHGVIMTEDKEAELGGNVTLRCILKESLDILQASWRKEIKEGFVNIAALSNNCTKVYISEEYISRLTITNLTLNDTALTIWNVSISDRGCYECMFNVYPTGPISKKTCLRVYDFHAFLHHHVIDGLLNATCTATGFPSPTITWHGSAGEKKEWMDEKNEWRVENPNGTVSIISNIHIKTSSSHYGQELSCKVTYRGQEMDYNVPRREKGHWNTVPVLLTTLALIFVVLIIAVVCWKQHRKKHSEAHPA